MALLTMSLSLVQWIKHQTGSKNVMSFDSLLFFKSTVKLDIVQDIHYLFSKSIPFKFFVILFFEVPMWSTRDSHPKVATP